MQSTVIPRNPTAGFVSVEQDGVQATALEIENDKIVAIYVMRNSDKLTRLADQTIH